ncbi:MAG: hypothetical protein LBV47_00175 [Bacteroidales bacterium]|nr:hypothetical protein [Bacteroidales bacterium]
MNNMNMSLPSESMPEGSDKVSLRSERFSEGSNKVSLRSESMPEGSNRVSLRSERCSIRVCSYAAGFKYHILCFCQNVNKE